MLSLGVVRSFRLHHINLSKKVIFLWYLFYWWPWCWRRFVVLNWWWADSPLFSGLAGWKQIHRQINSIGGGFELLNSIQLIEKWLHEETRAWLWRYWLWIWGVSPLASTSVEKCPQLFFNNLVQWDWCFFLHISNPMSKNVKRYLKAWLKIYF